MVSTLGLVPKYFGPNAKIFAIFFVKINTVTLSFVFDKYCPIIE